MDHFFFKKVFRPHKKKLRFFIVKFHSTMSSNTKKRSYSLSNSAKKGRYSLSTGYDRSRGGLQPGSRVSLMAAMRRRNSAELKGVDTNLSLTVISTSTTNASSFLLNAVAPGSGSFNRIGRKIQCKSLRIKGGCNFVMTPSAAGVVEANSLRMVVVWDRQPNSGTIPTWNAIFGATDQAGTETSTILSPLSYDNMSRFTVLKDKAIDCVTVPGNVVSTAVITQFYTIDEYIALGNRETTYSGQSATCTIADISTGALYVYFRAQSATATQSCTIDADTIARLRYMD